MFVAFITAATFLIFFLFKYNYTRCLWAYMGFSGLLIFGVLGAAIGYELIQTLMIPLDILTYSLCVYNVSIVGVLAVFFWPSPLAMRQGYLIAIAAIVAFYFTRIPEWTTWTLLIAMAIYDLYAVLTPGGPLRVIVELAEERNEVRSVRDRGLGIHRPRLRDRCLTAFAGHGRSLDQTAHPAGWHTVARTGSG